MQNWSASLRPPCSLNKDKFSRDMFLAFQRPGFSCLGPLCELLAQLQSLECLPLSSESYQVPLKQIISTNALTQLLIPVRFLPEPTLISLSPKPPNEKDFFLTAEIQFITIMYGSQGGFLKPRFSGLPMQEPTGLFFLYNGWVIR